MKLLHAIGILVVIALLVFVGYGAFFLINLIAIGGF